MAGSAIDERVQREVRRDNPEPEHHERAGDNRKIRRGGVGGRGRIIRGRKRVVGGRVISQTPAAIAAMKNSPVRDGAAALAGLTWSLGRSLVGSIGRRRHGWVPSAGSTSETCLQRAAIKLR
jgi:hypothetical protein